MLAWWSIEAYWLQADTKFLEYGKQSLPSDLDQFDVQKSSALTRSSRMAIATASERLETSSFFRMVLT